LKSEKLADYTSARRLNLVLGTVIAETILSMSENGTNSDTDLIGPSSLVAFKTGLGIEVRANIVRLRPQAVAFEIYAPDTILRLSEVLNSFQIIADTHPIYNGKAVVSGLLNTGAATMCEATLAEPLPGLDPLQFNSLEKICGAGFGTFLNQWQKYYRVDQDYKVVIADVETFLSSLRTWLERVEVTLHSYSAADRPRHEADIALGLRRQVSSALTNMFERFEEVAEKIEPDLRPVHRAFGQRQLHPHLLCAPFIHRTYAKPLGYAGDYEMMNMIVRNGLEGTSLYAKLANAFLLDQIGPQAVRNRVDYLRGRIADETCRVARLGRRARIYNIACGPAREVEDFLGEHPLANQTEFDLLDFNAETLEYAGTRMDAVRRKHLLTTKVRLIRKSVSQMLRANGKMTAAEQQYDLIYSSGLYDYLNDRIIKALNTYLYDRLAPGGLLTVGNFSPNLPVRNFIEHFLEWFLIYRNAKQLAELAPQQASPADCRVVAEPTGTNIFLEVRKPL
jgi:extracellular factor (EF) 3-hydroxypalmitic acid methyl ester biosynthesis protein